VNDVFGSARRATQTMWKRDPLLAAARLALGIAMGIAAFMTAAFVIAMPAVLIMNENVMDLLTRNGGPPETIWAVISVIALSGIVAGLSFFFFRDLYRIVASVESGDAFIPVNARRLQAMGWISVAVHIVGVPLSMTGKWLDQIFHRTQGGFEVSYFGLLLALVLFVLARVFREGARMREELDGTV
jgi:uncharacterized membrane protein